VSERIAEPSAGASYTFQSFVVLGGLLVTEALMIACAFAWVFVYSVLIHPGGDDAHYQAYAQVASPVVAVVMAGPIFWAMGRVMRRFGTLALRLAIAVVVVNLLADGSIVATLAEDVPYNAAMSMLAAAGKAGGAFLGARASG